MLNEGEVYFGLHGHDSDLPAVFEAIGIEWALTKPKGRLAPKGAYWRCSSGRCLAEYIDVYDLASSLICRIRPHVGEIIEAKNRFQLDATLQVVLTISTEDGIILPSIGFDREVLDFLHCVGATIDVDTYLI